MEQENQNELNQQDAQQENNSESPKTYTAEEYEELREKYNASTKEAQKLSRISKVAVDNTKFIKLYNSDKRQAEEVAKHFGRSAKELYEQVKAEYWDSESIDVEDIDERAEKIANKKFAEQSLKEFKDKYGISWKLDKTFTNEFKWLMEWKDWESEEVIKQAKRALKLCRDTDEFQEALNKANSRLSGAGITWSTRWDGFSNNTKSPYTQRKEQEAKQSIFGEYGQSKDF